jgi:succinyl-CoA synthetase beta subunit
MADYNVRVQKGKVASSAAEAAEAARWLLKEKPGCELIVKAQIHAGGRGKGTFNTGYKGGVKICKTAEEVQEVTSKMLGNYLITKQTPPEGQRCLKVLVL